MHGRPLSIHELCRLQGLNSNEMKITVTKPQMGALLGNGFTCTVVARVMAAAIQAAENSRDSDPRLEPDTYIGCMRGGRSCRMRSRRQAQAPVRPQPQADS